MQMDSKKIAYLGIYVALVILLTYIPFTGYIQIVPTISLVNIPIIVVIASVHLGFSGAIASSFTFGITAYVNSIFGSPISDPLPFMVSRFILGIIVGTIVTLWNINRLWKFVALTIITYVLNTFLFTSSLFIASSYNHVWSSGLKVWLGIIWVAFLIEISIGIFLSIPLYSLVEYIKSKDEQEQLNKW